MAFLAKEARLFRFTVFSRACSLQNEVDDPHFFTFLTSLTHHRTVVKVSGKKKTVKNCNFLFEDLTGLCKLR